MAYVIEMPAFAEQSSLTNTPETEIQENPMAEAYYSALDPETARAVVISLAGTEEDQAVSETAINCFRSLVEADSMPHTGVYSDAFSEWYGRRLAWSKLCGYQFNPYIDGVDGAIEYALPV